MRPQRPRSRPLPSRAHWLLVGLALAGGLRASAAGEVPRLVVQAPPELRASASRLEHLGPEALEPAMRRTGLADPGPPILVVLAPEASPAARARPAWVAGYAQGANGVVVLLPARVGRYPDADLLSLLQHEVAHVLIARAARGGEVPRWFDEGLAMASSRATGLGDRARLALAVLSDSRLPLARIDAAFAGGTAEVESAYALARDVVRELLARHGEDVGARILARVARGERFAHAFRGATGETVGDFERRYWRERSFWDRWLPILTSSVLLWGGIATLALLAFRRRRARDLATYQRWEEEERLRLAPPPSAEQESGGNGSPRSH